MIVVLGSHTDVGKTFVSCRLAERLVAEGRTVTVRKPVMSGFDPRPLGGRVDDSDAGLLARAAGARQSIDSVSPWRFPDPIAPDAAARNAGVTLTLDEIVAFAAAPTMDDVLLVETAGGVMSPLTDSSTMLDLAARLAGESRAGAILVVGAYLGGISHGLTAHAVLAARGVEVRAVVVSRASEAQAEPFRRFLPGATVLALPAGATKDHDVIGRLAALV